MSPPYTPLIEVNGNSYYPPPYSLPTLPSDLQTGLIPVGILAVLSVTSTLVLICFISYRLITWKIHYQTFLGYNQYVLLVLNLLLADMQQGAAYLISFHWVRMGQILAPSAPCTGQAWLLHSGDLSSGFFVLAIAIHTFYTAVHGKRVGHTVFGCLVVLIWLFAYFLTAVGLGIHGRKYFVRAGAWCWVSEAYEGDRLALHYVWVFLVQFGTIVIYVVTFFMLRQKTKRLFQKAREGSNPPNMATVHAVNRITMLMTLYPCVYVVLTLPLSAGRMWSYAHGGKPYSNAYALVAGCMLTSCGWVDSLLYTLTRKRLLKDTMPGSRREDTDWDDEQGSKGITHTRTVTVEGGQMMDVLNPAGHTPTDRYHTSQPSVDNTRPPSPAESFDPILNHNTSKYASSTALPEKAENEGSLGFPAVGYPVGYAEMGDGQEKRRSGNVTALPSVPRSWIPQRRSREP